MTDTAGAQRVDAQSIRQGCTHWNTSNGPCDDCINAGIAARLRAVEEQLDAAIQQAHNDYVRLRAVEGERDNACENGARWLDERDAAQAEARRLRVDIMRHEADRAVLEKAARLRVGGSDD